MQLETLNNVTFQSLAEPVLDLLTMTLTGLQGCIGKLSRYWSFTLLKVKSFIADNLTDKELTPELINRLSGISIRYINQFFLMKKIPR